METGLNNNRVTCWQSPSAMWLILAAYAVVGCIFALLARSWLTRGSHLQTEIRG